MNGLERHLGTEVCGVWYVCRKTNTIGHADRKSTWGLGIGGRTPWHEYSTYVRIIQSLDMMMISYLYDDLPLGNVYHGNQYHIAALREVRVMTLRNIETSQQTVLMWFVSTISWSQNFRDYFFFSISSSTSRHVTSRLHSKHCTSKPSQASRRSLTSTSQHRPTDYNFPTPHHSFPTQQEYCTLNYGVSTRLRRRPVASLAWQSRQQSAR